MTGPARFADPRADDAASLDTARDWHRDDVRPRARFGRILGWTVLGALIPGSGLVAAGKRRLGGFILFVVVVLAAALVEIVWSGSAKDLGLRLAVRPEALRAVAAVIAAGGVLWAAVIIGTHASLRQGRLNLTQRIVSLGLVLGLVALALVASGFGARTSLAQAGLVKSVFNGNAPARLKQGATRINVLLIGSDAGAGRVGVRPDTLILASIDTGSGDTVLFSLPRNLQNVPFPAGTPGARAWPNGFNCGSECLINAVWQWGEQHADQFEDPKTAGLTATRQAVSATLGLPVDYYAMVNLNGFQDVVDAMGGVTLTVPRDLPIGGGKDQYTLKPNPILGYIKAGTQKLDGYHALWFARSREGSDDYDRMRRQRCVLGAIKTQADPKRLALEYPKLAASAKKNVSTDIPPGELDEWVNLSQKVQKASLKSLPFTNQVITSANPDFAKMHELVQEAIAPAKATSASTAATSQTVSTPPSAIKVAVLNGTGTDGLGKEVAAELAAKGFRIASVGNASGSYPTSVVRHDPAYDQSGRTVELSVKGSDATPVSGLGDTIQLIVGDNYAGVQSVQVAGGSSPSAPAAAPETISTGKNTVATTDSASCA